MVCELASAIDDPIAKIRGLSEIAEEQQFTSVFVNFGMSRHPFNGKETIPSGFA